MATLPARSRAARSCSTDGIGRFLAWSRFRRWWVVLPLLGVFLMVRGQIDPARIGAPPRHADPRWAGAAALAQAAVLALIGVKYRLLLARLGHRVGLFPLLRLHLRRHLVATALPFGGPPSMVLFARDLRARGVPTDDAVFTGVLYGAVGQAGFVVYSAPVMVWLAATGQVGRLLAAGGLAFAVVSGAALCCMRHAGRHDPPPWLARRLPLRAADFLGTVRSHRIRPRDLLTPVAVTVGINGLGGFMLYACLRAVGQHPAVASVLGARVVGTLVTFVSPILQGAGAVELTTAGALRDAGTPAAAALAGTLLFRLFQLWLPLALGVGALLDVRRVRSPLPSLRPIGWSLGATAVGLAAALFVL